MFKTTDWKRMFSALKNSIYQAKYILAAIFIAFFLVPAAVKSIMFTINEGERGVLLTTGHVSEIVIPGLHFKMPFMQEVVKMSIRTTTSTFTNIRMYSFDQQPATLDISVTWHHTPDQIQAAYVKYGSDGIVKTSVFPKLLDLSKNVFGKVTAVQSIQNREELTEAIAKELKEIMVGSPLVIESIQIQNVTFSPAYIKAVELAAQAKADVERARSELLRVEQEAMQQVKKAESDAKAIQLRADAEAHATTVRGEAEAIAITVRGKAFRENPNLPSLITAEKWDGKLPVTMLPGASLPFVTVK